MPTAGSWVSGGPRARSAAEIRFWIGRALVQLARFDEALDELRAARELADKGSDPRLVVECLDWEAGALYLSEDAKALGVAEQALRACQALEPRLPRTEARILEHLGSIHVRNANVEAAISYYEEAVESHVVLSLAELELLRGNREAAEHLTATGLERRWK